MNLFKLSSYCVCLRLEDSRGREKIPTVLLCGQTGLGRPKPTTLGMRPLDDLNGIIRRQFHLGVKYNIPMERHFPVFDHRRDGRQKHPLLGRVETIPAREI